MILRPGWLTRFHPLVTYFPPTSYLSSFVTETFLIACRDIITVDTRKYMKQCSHLKKKFSQFFTALSFLSVFLSQTMVHLCHICEKEFPSPTKLYNHGYDVHVDALQVTINESKNWGFFNKKTMCSLFPFLRNKHC